jgi:hypothetical protein
LLAQADERSTVRSQTFDRGLPQPRRRHKTCAPDQTSLSV